MNAKVSIEAVKVIKEVKGVAGLYYREEKEYVIYIKV